MKVFKYLAPVEDRFTLFLPAGARVLHAEGIDDKVAIWALVDPRAGEVGRRFRLVSTGERIEESGPELLYVNTFFPGEGLVMHLFEVTSR